MDRQEVGGVVGLGCTTQLTWFMTGFAAATGNRAVACGVLGHAVRKTMIDSSWVSSALVSRPVTSCTQYLGIEAKYVCRKAPFVTHHLCQWQHSFFCLDRTL